MASSSQQDPEDVFKLMSNVFAKTRTEANNRTKFRALDKFTKNLATVNRFVLEILASEFPRCSMAAIRNALAAFEDHYVPAYAALYVIQHELPHYDLGGWVPSLSLRSLNKTARKKVEIKHNDPRWTPALRQEIRYIREITECVTCPICFDLKPVRKTLCCQAKDDEPGRSDVHRFCYKCIRSGAKEAADGTLKVDVLGIACMGENCKNVLHWNDIRELLPAALRKRLSELIQNENLRATGMDIESCKNCGFSGVPELPKEAAQIFRCPNCTAQHCRLCGEKWTEEHYGRNCSDLQSAALRRYQEKLTDAVLRVCKRCGLSYEKKDGCNKIVCRCGATYCYLCRKENVDYSHFCTHTMQATPEKCRTCSKTCRLWATPTRFIRIEVARIKEEARKDPRIADQVSPVEPMSHHSPKHRHP